MSKVQINNVVVLNNPANFSSPLQFEITFDCMENLEDDLEWKLTYVGSAESDTFDQILDTIYVGPVPEGRHMFVFQADAPDPTKIPAKDLIGATVILITCSYHQQEFIRVGYFVNCEYDSEELRENPPEVPEVGKIQRNIMADEPRVTRFRINWGDQSASGSTANGEGESMEDAGASSSHTSNGIAMGGMQPYDEDELVGGGSSALNIQDTDSMLEPLAPTYKDVHSIDESSNVEMEMAF